MQESQPLFASDANNQATYDKILSKYIDFLGGDNSAYSHLNARKKLDSYMRKQFPKIAKYYKNQIGEDIKANAYDDIRTISNELIAEALPANSPYRDQLMREHYLISLRDQIYDTGSNKAFKSGGGSKDP